eukprot:jgi/Astpho2/4948/fgenesh1_pg.00070_%23_9_t
MARAGMIGALQDIEAGSQLLPQPALDPQPFLSGSCLWDALMPAMEALAEAVATAAHAADEGAQWLLQVSAAEQQAAREALRKEDFLSASDGLEALGARQGRGDAVPDLVGSPLGQMAAPAQLASMTIQAALPSAHTGGGLHAGKRLPGSVLCHQQSWPQPGADGGLQGLGPGLMHQRSLSPCGRGPPPQLQHHISMPADFQQGLRSLTGTLQGVGLQPRASLPRGGSSPPRGLSVAEALRAAGVRVVQAQELRLGRCVGSGSFGEVREGTWRQQHVAVKILLRAADDPEVAAAFVRECQTMAHLPAHPNVLPLLAAAEQPRLMVVTPFCSQGSLYALLAGPAALTWETGLLDICLGAARGLAHLHAHGIMHRDVKTGNMLLDGHLECRIADFGYAKLHQTQLRKAEARGEPLSADAGTYQYMAPEVYGTVPVSQKQLLQQLEIHPHSYGFPADVFSYALVLLECATGQVALGVERVEAHMYCLKMLQEGWRPDIPGSTPLPIERLIRDCWQALPNKRPTFPEIATRLEMIRPSLAAPEPHPHQH